MKNVVKKMEEKSNIKTYSFIIIFALVGLFLICSCSGPTVENELPLSKHSTITSFPLANDVESENFINVLHQQYHLKPITTNENGITINSMPNKSYCYIPFDALSDKNTGQIQEITINSKKDKIFKDKLFYELQRFQKDKIYLLAFVTYETATNITNLDGETQKEFTFFPEKNPEYNHLAFIPINRIQQIKVRNILLDNKDSLKVHDLRIK